MEPHPFHAYRFESNHSPHTPPIFTGADVSATLNGKKINDLESVTFTEELERGRVVIKGSFVFSEWNVDPATKHGIRVGSRPYNLVLEFNNQSGGQKIVKLNKCSTTKITRGYSQNDLGCAIGVEFECKDYHPAKPV